MYATHVLQALGAHVQPVELDDLMVGSVRCDTLINVYYGTIGDSGIVAGLCAQYQQPFVGNSQLSCALMYNKIVAKRLIRSAGFATPAHWYGSAPEQTAEELEAAVLAAVGLPMMAKPVDGAASENMWLLAKHTDVQSFIREKRALIDSGFYFFEQFIPGTEISAGYSDAIGIEMPVAEIELRDAAFQTNAVKFSSGGKRNIVPARLPADGYTEAQRAARVLHAAFGATALSRTDMIYSFGDERLYVLEINSNPGLLESSLFPLIAATAGVNAEMLFDRLIQHSLAASLAGAHVQERV